MHRVRFRMATPIAHKPTKLLVDLVETVAKESIEVINKVRELDPTDRIERLKHLGSLLTETLKRGEEKVALAKTTFDAVSPDSL